MKYRILWISFACAFACALLSHSSLAQQPPPPPPPGSETADAPKDAKDSAQDPNSIPPQVSVADAVIPGSTESSIHPMNGAGPLPTGRVSPLQLGPIYLQSADYLQVGEAINATGQVGTVWRSISMFRTNIVFDHQFRTSRFAVQYQPRLSVVDGRTQTDTSNLSAGWNSQFQLTPVLTMALNDNFTYFAQQGQFDGLNLMGDLTTGSLVESHFLDGNGHFLNNRTELAFKYLLGPRSRLDVTPFFEYYSASQSQVVNQSESPGVRVTYGYLLSPTKVIALEYEARDTYFSKLLPTTFYQTFSVNYSQQLTSSLHFSVTGGVTTASSRQLNTTQVSSRSTQATATGSASLIKLFHDSSLTFQYYRGQSTGLHITNGFADRYDLSYSRQLSRRMRMDLGSGYYREFLSATNTSGVYASGGLGYSLTNTWSLQGLYAFKYQQNGGLLYATGTLHYLSFGVRWEPGRRPVGY